MVTNKAGVSFPCTGMLMWSDIPMPLRIILAWIDPPKGSKASTAACAEPEMTGSAARQAFPYKRGRSTIIFSQQAFPYDYLFILLELA
jgi:hypothetical protein